FFSTLTINADTPEFSFRLDLKRSESFPAHRFSCKGYWFHSDKRYTAFPVPKDSAHLQLQLGESLGAGRTGTAYSAQVSAPLPQLSRPVPSELVVKFAKLNHCRNLAREAWIYNYLDRIPQSSGTIIPRCYGFFTTTLTERKLVPSAKRPYNLPWSPVDGDHAKRDDDLSDDVEVEEFLDEIPSELITKERSPWNSWVPDLKKPLVAVLILEKGGPMYNEIDDEDPLVKTDIKQIIRDLSLCGVAHGDFRMSNLVRSPTTTEVCPHHKCVHKWNIIDFDRAWVLDLGVECLPDAIAAVNPGYRQPGFYGWNPSK
ncbi:hypothetical protein F5050DRAFT_1565617, partial [Lentinula boryana]